MQSALAVVRDSDVLAECPCNKRNRLGISSSAPRVLTFLAPCLNSVNRRRKGGLPIHDSTLTFRADSVAPSSTMEMAYMGWTSQARPTIVRNARSRGAPGSDEIAENFEETFPLSPLMSWFFPARIQLVSATSGLVLENS